MFSARKKKNFINLLPQEEFESSTMGRVLHWLLSTFRYLVIVTEMVVIAAFLSRFYFDSVNADLNDEIKQKQTYIEAYLPFEKNFRAVQAKLSIYNQARQNEGKAQDLVELIVSKMPADLYLEEINLGIDGETLIRGASLSERSIQQLVVNLADDPKITSAQLVQVESRANSAFLIFNIQITDSNIQI